MSEPAYKIPMKKTYHPSSKALAGHLAQGGPILIPTKSPALLSEKGKRRESWERIRKAPAPVLAWGKK